MLNEYHSIVEQQNYHKFRETQIHFNSFFFHLINLRNQSVFGIPVQLYFISILCCRLQYLLFCLFPFAIYVTIKYISEL